MKASKRPPVPGAIWMTAWLALGLAQAIAASTNEPTRAADAPWRDPFWPAGYAPRSALPPPPPPPPEIKVRAEIPPPKVQVDWEAAQKLLTVNGYGESGQVRWCLINGIIAREGETYSTEYSGMCYAWRIVHVDPIPELMVYERLTAIKIGSKSHE